MRYFKIVLACFGFIFAVVGITVGVMFLTGKFDKEVIQPNDIAFDITEKLTEDDFEVVLSTTTENVTEKDVTLSLTNQTEKDGFISDGVITVPKVVKLGTPFVVQVNKTHYAGMDEEWNVGGTSVIRAKSTNPLIQEAAPLTVEVDVPVHSLSVDLVTTTGTKLGTVAAKDVKGLMKILATGEENKQVVELAVGSIVRLKPVFTPAKSGKTTKGEDRRVIFEIPTAWRGIHIDFVDGENDLIEILRQTTVEDIKINAYCFRTSADEYAAKSGGYSDDELITMMNANGISGESHQIFGTNQKITSFTGSTKDDYINLAINSPLTLVANGTIDGAFDLGLAIASDAGVARLEDKIAVIKLYAYWQNGETWEDAGDKLLIVGQTSSNKTNGVKAKINKRDSNLSSWKVIASETGKYKLVAKLSYEYYSSSSSTPTIINFEVEYGNILVSDPISSDVNWKSTLPAIKTLVVLDGETAAEKYYPTLNLSDYVEIKNSNATYKAVRFFAYSTEGVNLKDILGCTLYDGNFAVPDSSETYEVFEIPNGILTVKDVGTFRIFFATVVSDYLGNPKLQFEQYLFESFSNTNTINVVKSLKSLDASMTVNVGEEGKEFNKNTDENTKDYIFHVRQQDENVFTLSLFVSDIEIFERDYLDGKIHIDFLLAGEKSNILTLSDTYVVDAENKRIDFQVSVKALPDSVEPTLDCKISYELDHRLDKFVSNNGNKAQIKVLNGYAQDIYFEAVKDANPKNSAENPIQVEIKFNAGSDNVATNIEYVITLNGQELLLADLSKVVINEEALNKTYTLSSNKPSIIAVEDSLEEGAKLSILGSTQDEDVVVTATAADGSELSTNLYFKVLKSRQITLTPNKSEIEIDGYQGNTINFRSYFDAKAGEIDLNNLLEYNISVDDATKFAFADDTLRIVSTLGRDASLQLHVTSEFGFTKIIPIRVVSCISASTNYAFNDLGLDDKDFVDRGETPPTERGTRVYAENTKDITFVLTQTEPVASNISISADDFELPSGVESFSCGSGIVSISFEAVDKMTERTIIFRKNFSEGDQYAFVYTMKFLVFPNIKSALLSDLGTEEIPASYKNGETIIYDANDNTNGLIKLERILGSNTISEHPIIEAKINGEWQVLSSSDGKYMLPSSYRATDGGFVEVRVTYDGCLLNPIKIFMNPFFDASLLLDAKLLYDGQLYVPFVANGENTIALADEEGVTYSIISGTTEQYIRIRSKQIEKLDRLYTKIITSEKLRIENNNGETLLPIIILPVNYPFVAYSMIENSSVQETYRTVDLKQVIESETIYDTLEAGSDEVVDLHEKLLVDGLDEAGAVITITNADGSTNSYINFDQTNLIIKANSVGKDKMIYVNVKCGAEFEEAYSFVYRLKITANQHIEVFYPYIEYNEEYNVADAYEYLYFNGKNQVSVDLLEEFDAEKTPNKALLDKLFETTNGKSYARRFVVVREKDEQLIPTSNKDLHFEIASVGIGKTVVPAAQVSNYATITERTSTSGELEGASLFINKGLATETIIVTVRAYTESGAEAFYRFKVVDTQVPYKVYYENQRVTSDNYAVAANGEVNLNNKVLVKIDENPEQIVSPNSYKFYLIIRDKTGTDYSQIITLNGGIISVSALVNDVETAVVIYNATGEIARFKLTLKCTIDYEVKSSTIGTNSTYNIGESIEFFNTSQSGQNYSMQEIDTTLFVREYLNDFVDDQADINNLYKEIGGYSIKDISTNYNQYVLLDNIKIYAENLVDIWEGKFYLDSNAKYEVKSEAGRQFIYYNGNVINVTVSGEQSVVKIPLTTTSTTNSEDVIEYVVTTDGSASYVIIPHFSFTKGNDNRDFVLFDELVTLDEGGKLVSEFLPFEPNATPKSNQVSRETYVYEYINGQYIRYRVTKIFEEDGKTIKELKVAMLRVVHNDKQYIANVDSGHNDHEYISIDGVRHYFTRFYQINYSGLAEYELDKDGNAIENSNNVPYVRYMISKEEYENETINIDLSKILFFTQGNNNEVLKLDGDKYSEGSFQFFLNDGTKLFESEESETSEEGESQTEKSKSKIITISRADIKKNISIIVKDTTGNFDVGRLNIVPTIETSTSTRENNKTLMISAGDTSLIDYKIASDTISLGQYKGAMGSGFTGVAKDDHTGWIKYLYSSNQETSYSIEVGEESGEISGLKDQTPWGKISVDAKLQYSGSATLTTSISFAAWGKEIFGTDSTITYSDLTTANVVVKCFDEKGNEKGSIAASGDITLPYGNYKVMITLGKKCSCGKFVTLGTSDTHIHDYELKETSTKTYDSLDGLEDYNPYFGMLNALKSVVVPDVGKIVLTGDLTQQDETWTLSEGGQIELFEFGKEVTFEATSPFTKTIKQNLEDSKTITLPQGAINPSIETEGISGSYDADTRTYTFGDEVAIGTEISIKYYYPINNNIKKQINPYDISSEFKTLFPQGVIDYAFTGIESDDDKTWNKFLEKCTVEINGEKCTGTTLGDGATTQFSFVITTKDPAHTGMFYVVNQEADNKTIHATGNLKKINNSLCSYESTDGNTIDKVVSAGTVDDTKYWVLPMATNKTLTDAGIQQVETIVSGLFANPTAPTAEGSETESEGTTGQIIPPQRMKYIVGGGNWETIEGLKNHKLSTAAGFLAVSYEQTVFNTITVYQNDYAIGKIHIYLEDFVGDTSATNYYEYKYTCTIEDQNYILQIDDKTGTAKITFEITKGEDATTLTTKIEATKFIQDGEPTTISDINDLMLEESQKQSLGDNKQLEIVSADKKSKDVYVLSEGAELTSSTSEGETTWMLTSSITKTTFKALDEKTTIYITQNAIMQNNEFLFENGLLIFFEKTVLASGTQQESIILKMIDKTNVTDFAFGDYVFHRVFAKDDCIVQENETSMGNSSAGNTNGEKSIKYYEGLVDLIKQPSSNSRIEGNKVYKAEKIGSEKDDSDVIYKDRIVGKDFNFDNWDYFTSYVDKSGQTHEGNGQNVVINELSDQDKRLKVVINNITDTEGNTFDGYTFFVDLGESSVVTIVGGQDGGTATSPSTPINGGAIASNQGKTINLNGDVFTVGASSATVSATYTGDRDVGEMTGTTDEEKNAIKQEIVKALFEQRALSYLKGVWTSTADGSQISSTMFRFEKDGEQTKISIVFEVGEKSYAYEIDQSNLEITPDENLGKGTFSLELNEDLFDFSAEIKEKTGPSEPVEGGVEGSTGAEGESGTEGLSEEPTEGSATGEGESEGEGSTTTTTKEIVVTITRVYTFGYSIENNSTAIDVKNFQATGELEISGKSVDVDTIVQFKFTIFRGRNGAAKAEAIAYYSLTVKPSFTAIITYPTISIKTEGETGALTTKDEQLTTELFYASAGKFDVNEAADLSINNTPRIAVTKHAYGTATKDDVSTPCEVIYESNAEGGTIKKIKIGNNSWQEINQSFTDQGEVTLSGDLSGYTISIYIPTLNVRYTATSTQSIIKSEETKTATSVTNDTGKFSFDFEDAKVAQADVIISVQAVDGNKNVYTFGQYKFTVFKDPVITLKTTTDASHMDGNGNEILPIDGGAALKPFDTTKAYVEIEGQKYEVVDNKIKIDDVEHSVDNGKITIDEKVYEVVYYNLINKTPRVQFVYNNKILNEKHEKYGDKLTANGSNLTNFVVLNNKIENGVVAFKYGLQNISGTYKYVTKWDYKLNPVGLNTSTVEGVTDSETGELLTYYELKAGETYDVVETFGITKLFDTKDKTFAELVAEFESGTLNEVKACVQFSSDQKKFTVLGAPNFGHAFEINIYPFGKSEPHKTIGIKIIPSIEFNINYQHETIFEGDSSSNIYGLISNVEAKNALTYNLVTNGKSNDFSLEVEGVLSDMTDKYTFTLVEATDLVASIVTTNAGADVVLNIGKAPVLNSRRVVIKITDNYGYVEYLRYVVAAKTQVGVSTGDITFTTGEEIQWTNEQPFPLLFKTTDGVTDQLTSFYTAEISGATKDNISDTYGAESSLKVGDDGKLYGVQLDSVITKTTTETTTESGEETTKSHYIPFEDGSSISFDTYKLIAVDKDDKAITLKSFDTYKGYYFKIIYKITTETTETKSGELGSENIPNTLLSESGAFMPVKIGGDTGNYYTDYTIEFYKTSTSTTADAIIKFTALKVTKTDNLYYASRTSPTDCYTFAYAINVGGTDNIVNKTNNIINNIGNKQYGAASSINTTLKISVYDGDVQENTKLIDTVDVGILLKFGIYPQITQQNSALISYDYVGLGDKISDVLSKKSFILASSSEDTSSVTKKFSTVLGEISAIKDAQTFPAMKKNETLKSEEYDYKSETRLLTLIIDLTSKDELNHIKYTYDSKSNKLTIGYKDVTLVDGKYVDELEGITYAVEGNTLKLSKKIDNQNKATINNKEYTVNSINSTTVTYTTLYESIFVVWTYKENTYWGQWNYKVVDKFNSVIAGENISVSQDGTFNVKLDWVADGWRFNANTWKLINTATKTEYPVSYKSTIGENGYYVTLDGVEYKIVVSDGNMTFQNGSDSYKPDGSSALTLTEEMTTNSSWADAIILTGLDGEKTSLKMALDDNKVALNVNSEALSSSDNVAIKTTSESETLSGKIYNIEISYVGIDGSENQKILQINGKDVRISFSSMTF